MRRPVLALVAAVLASSCGLSACGLPVAGGVRVPGDVEAEQPRGGQVVVLPAGPMSGATAVDVVEGFLSAQGSPEGDHAVARQFLTADAARSWDADAGVEVYDPGVQPPQVTQTSAETVTVVARRSAVLGPDGSYRRADGDIVDDFRVVCPNGVCRIAALEKGLRLTRSDLVRSYAPRPVHFLAPSTGEASAAGHLVADLVWLPRAGLAQSLVQAVLAGPTEVLRRSVSSAVPAGTRLVREVETASDGTVTVDLSDQVRALDDRRRQQLSAQLVWTLRVLGTGFTRLRLQVEGEPLEVDGSRTPAPAAAWPAYDPERLRPRAPALYVEDRQLRSLVDGGLTSSDATEGRQPVDVAASSPDGFLALLTGRREGEVELRTGPQAGPFTLRTTGALTSPTWGSGEQGLFLLRSGSVVLLPPEGGLQPVEVVDEARPVRRVQVARDGVRVALLVGQDLLVGRLERAAGGTRISGLREVAPGLTGLVDVAWESGTSLIVLATFGAFGVLPGRVAVDGFAPDPPLDSRLPAGVVPVRVTAAAGRPVVLAGRLVGGAADDLRLYREEGQQFRRQVSGREPFYPG